MCTHLAYHPDTGQDVRNLTGGVHTPDRTDSINRRCCEMSACALLVIGALALSFVAGRSGLRARPALWRQFSAYENPRADEKGGADNRRRRKCGEILHHEGYPGLRGQSLIAAYRTR